jgi:hypothetical protein
VFEEYEAASATIETLAKRVNKKVMQMFEKAEQEYAELKRKKDVVENDKGRIEQVCWALGCAAAVALTHGVGCGGGGEGQQAGGVSPSAGRHGSDCCYCLQPFASAAGCTLS